MYNDPSGELSWKSVGNWFKRNSKVITAVVTIAAAVVATVLTAGLASPLLAGAIVGASAGFAAGAVGTWTQGGSFLQGVGSGLVQGSIGAVTGAVAAGAGAWAVNNISSVAINGLKISGAAVKGFAGGVIGGGFGGFASGTAGALLSGANFGDALNAGLKGAGTGAALGGLVGAGRGFRHAKINNQNPWTGENLGGKSSKILNTTSKQLQRKFKHAGDFGVEGNYNKANSTEFNSAINKHINSPDVLPIKGTYRGNPVMHHLNPNTGLNVISNPDGTFLSGWKLNSLQLQNVIGHGGL